VFIAGVVIGFLSFGLCVTYVLNRVVTNLERKYKDTGIREVK
jgi:hypothetical protein